MKKKIFLGIETAGTHLGVALHDLSAPGAPCVARHFEPAPGKQAERLFPTVTALLKSRRLSRKDLAAVAVDHGPGSFTGVRLGVAAARAVAQALALPVIGVSALEAMAWAADVPDKEAIVVARIPALPGETYHAAYRRGRKGWATVSAPAWTRDADLDALLKRLSGGPIAVVMVEPRGEDTFRPPDGAALFRVPAPDPSALVSLAIARHGRRLPASRFPVDKVAPVYLQPSWAERLR